jgi:2-polyprenyl-3-methyl-5-hydroxy-6-metoxy-1,4-benzoquinol methylase
MTLPAAASSGARVPASCGACGASDARTLLEALDPEGISLEPFRVVRCASCGAAYVNPRPAAAELGAFYVRGYYGRPGEDSGPVGRALGRLLMALRAATAERGMRKPGRVLDVGCGDGTFLAALRRRGWTCAGVEVNEEAAARAAAREGLTIHDQPLEKLALPAKSFDLVTFWHSLEHVPDPAGQLARAAALVADGGRLLVAFPNADSWDLKLFGASWFHLDPPRHLHYFTPESLSALLGRLGLKAERASHWSFEYNPFGFAQSALNLVTRRPNYLYRRLKGTLPIGSMRDALATAVLAVPAGLLALPYAFAAALFRRSGCVVVAARRR